jgi:Mn-dependent DtxR family transcriptional regulator
VSESLSPTWPPAAVDPGQTRVLVEVIRLHEESGYVTVRAVAAACGISTMGAHHRLRRLRDAGLVGWEDGRIGTLRPLVRRVG